MSTHARPGPTTQRSATSWTNSSVKRLIAKTPQADPVAVILNRARHLALRAMDDGWDGPPFDPLELAEYLNLSVTPNESVREARTVPSRGKGFAIEYNPNRPPARVRYSVAHEIAHTLFPDCRLRVRHRGHHERTTSDSWQLEALCNIAAAELLMPVGSLMSIQQSPLSIDQLVTLRQQFQVSMEAMLIRTAHLTTSPVSMFCADRIEASPNLGRYRLNYAVASGSSPHRLRTGILLPARTTLKECTSIGYTTVGSEKWDRTTVRLEAVGVSPYPGSRFPRVVGLAWPSHTDTSTPAHPLSLVRGNALEPRGDGPRILVHVVNDRSLIWGGGGFAAALRRKWPAAQADFQDHCRSHRGWLRLRQMRLFRISETLSVASLVAQEGFGESPRRRIRYSALQAALQPVATEAKRTHSSIHMPRIGTGQGGGSWSIVEDIVRSICCDAGIPVTVYALPDAALAAGLPLQAELAFGSP